MLKILLITEILKPPYDEGIKKTVFNLYIDLKKHYNVKVISRASFISEEILTVNTNALFFSKEVKRVVKEFKPDVLIYFPFASATFASYLRFKLLSYYAKRAKPILVSMQPKPLKKWQVPIVRFIRPPFALTPSPQLKTFWDKLKVNSQLLPLLTDLKKFKPLTNEVYKVDLRKKYNLPLDAFIISHMGHLNEGRNLGSLIPLQRAGYQIIVIGSSSTPLDSLGSTTLKQGLIDEGVIVLDGYIENIEEVYQLSDLYIFPVVAKTGSIGLPLSILEARACGIPVLTTDFGSVQTFLESDSGNIYYSNPVDFLSCLKHIEDDSKTNRLKTNVHLLNQLYYELINKTINS